MATIAPPNLNPLPLDQQALARLAASIAPQQPTIAAPGPSPRAYTIPGIPPRPDATAGPLRAPGIAPPAAPPPALMPPGASMGPLPAIASPAMGPSPAMEAVQQAKQNESAIRPPNYTGKLGVLQKIGDAAGRLFAPGIEQRLGIGTIGYQDRRQQAEGQTDRAEKQAATEAGIEKSQADAGLASADAAKAAQGPVPPYEVQNTAGGLMRINKATGDVEPVTFGGKPVLAPAPQGAPEIHATDNGFVMVDRSGKVTPLLLNGQPVMPPAPKPTGLAPEIGAQVTAAVGPEPDAKNYPGGAKDPKYLSDLDRWGKAIEKIRNDEAAASGEAHGAGYNETRPVAVFDPQTGNFVYMSAKDAEARGAAPGSLANSVMGRQAQIADIQSGSQALRSALTARGLAPFSPKQTAQLSLAMRDVDPSTMKNAITDLMASGLTPQQQDLVADLFSMQERALSLRSVAGMGQGSDTMRHAIIKALPNITSGSTELALKQLNVFDNLVGNLARGIGGIKGSKAETGTGPAVGTVEGGYRFKGGDPADKANWEKVNP